MKKNSNNSFLKQIAIIIIGGLLLFLITNNLDYITTNSERLFDWSCEVLNIQIELKSIVISAIIILILGILIKFLYRKFKTPSKVIIEPPEYNNFTSYIFKKWKWSWNWKYNHNLERFVVNNLRPHCPKCNTKLLIRNFPLISDVRCSRCSYIPEIDEIEYSDEIINNIDDYLERMYEDNT